MALSPQTAEQAAWYLAGIIDGEGHVSKDSNRRYVQISNTDPWIILAVQDALDLLEIEYTTHDAVVKEGHTEAWRVNILRRSEIDKLADVVFLQSEKKDSALQAHVNAPHKSWSDDDPRIDEIRSMYLDDGRSIRDIAAYFETSRGRIGNMMNRYEIPIRDRIEAVRKGRRATSLSESHKTAIGQSVRAYHEGVR